MSHSPRSSEYPSNASTRSFGTGTSQSQSQSHAPARTVSDADSPRPVTANSQRDAHAARTSTALPSLATLTGEADGGSHTPWRPIGVHSILNPTGDGGGHAGPSRHAPSPEMTKAGAAHALPRTSLPSPRIRKRGEPSPVRDDDSQSSTRLGRRILTPKSPGLRAASLGAHRSPSLGISLASRIPLHAGEGRRYTVEPGEGRGDAAVPPLPPLATTRPSLPTIQPSDPGAAPGPADRRPSNATFTPQSSMAGPHLSMGPPQPAYPARRSASPPYQHGPGPSALSSGLHAPSPSEGPGNYGALRPAGYTYGEPGWKMTLDTQQGPMVVPVKLDLQQASKMADEKRKRNAGASARFRARRKEKEKEASTMISGLQQELREMTEERDFYLNERNVFRDLHARSSGGVVPPRPASPPSRHVPLSQGSGRDTTPIMEYGRRSDEPLPGQRRRTGDYAPAFATPSPSTSNYSAQFAPPAPLSYALPTPNAPSGFPEARGAPHGPAPAALPPSSAAPRGQAYDPFRRDVLDRNWNPGK